jgi:3-methyladenine DNA glycosylase AlkD
MTTTRADRPSASEVLKALQKLGKPGTAAIYARHGVKGACYGVPYAALSTLVKRLPVDHALALALWRSGVHDARVLATRIADPARATPRELARLLADTDNYVLCDAVAALIARTRHARTLSLRFIDAEDEWVSAAGYDVLSILALEGKLDAALGKRLIARIARDLHRAPNRTRHSMNAALIALGGAIEGLAEPALAAARALGTVEVDHGKTGCKTPAAGPYIARMQAHRARRAPARTKAAAKRRTQQR